MAESHVLSALNAKRARIAGEIIQARDLIASMTEELAVLDAVTFFLAVLAVLELEGVTLADL